MNVSNLTVEKLILSNILHDEEYTRKVIPFVRSEFFHDPNEKKIFNHIKEYIQNYNNRPTKEALVISLSEDSSMIGDGFEKCCEIINECTESHMENDPKWLSDITEEFCKDKAVYNAIMESIHIIDGKSKDKTQNAIPEILSDALSVSFDTHIGHDYLEDADDRYDFYHRVESRIPFDLEFFNTITNGGVPKKTLNICLAGTGVGKSLYMCHHAANCLTQGMNVLYITCEMAEERIAERIDANLMDIQLDDLRQLPKMSYDKKIERLQSEVKGKFIIKEYPTATANVTHFRHLMDELRLKKDFVPDIVFIDYLNICASSRYKNNGMVNSYTYIKAIAEELRGMAVEYDIPIFSATQTNRTGFVSTDVGLEDTSESFGLPATADFMFALIATDDLDDMGVVMVKQLKNRYNDAAANRKFLIGINRSKMKLFDAEDGVQSSLVQTNQTEQKKNGSGFDGSNFDEKFLSGEKNKDFTSWNI